MKLTPTLKAYIWGGTRLKELYGRDNGTDRISESWEVSVHPDGESRLPDGTTLTQYLKTHPQAVKGEFPVLIKYIDAKEKLSVQVHPDDAYARAHEGDNGKTEMWYVIDAAEGAGIYCGFKKATTREELTEKARDGSVEELLNFIPVKKGDCYLIKAGTVHAICAGCLICEVQQSSNVTYRVYDYNRTDADGRKRPLQLEKALDVIDFSVYRDQTGSGRPEGVEGGSERLLTSCEYFTCKMLTLDGTHTMENADSFTALCVIGGEGELNGEPFASGDSFFVPAGERVSVSGRAEILIAVR